MEPQVEAFKSLEEIEAMTSDERREYFAGLLIGSDPTTIDEMIAERDAALSDSTAA